MTQTLANNLRQIVGSDLWATPFGKKDEMALLLAQRRLLVAADTLDTLAMHHEAETSRKVPDCPQEMDAEERRRIAVVKSGPVLPYEK